MKSRKNIQAANSKHLKWRNASRLALRGFILSAVSLGALGSLSAADSDLDELDDAWEIEWFGDLSALANDDNDGDGATNLDEQETGSNPNVADGIPGALNWEFWGNTASAPLESAVYLTEPDKVDVVAGVGSLAGQADSFHQRLRGTVLAPVTGTYRFYIAGDNDLEFWISSDESPYSRRVVASCPGATGFQQFNQYASQMSREISLVAGQRYYIEVLHREAAGLDHLSLAWSYTAAEPTTLTQVPAWTNWARQSGAVASQSSIYYGYGANRAIDGNRYGDFSGGSITHTLNESGAWWQVDLGEERTIDRVVLFNRTHPLVLARLTNFKVSVLDTAGQVVASKSYGLDVISPTFQWVLPTTVTGRVVKVELLGPGVTNEQYLCLAEVEVIGESTELAPASRTIEIIPSQFLASYLPPADDENDNQLPDDWELAAGFDHTVKQNTSGGPYADPDGDLVPNWLEAAQGLDPNAPSLADGYIRYEQTVDAPQYSLEDFRQNDKAFGEPEVNKLLEVLPGELSGQIHEVQTASDVRGVITAPVSGEYVFWVSSSTTGELWLSSDATPFKKQRIAALTPDEGTGHGVLWNHANRWDQFASQMSKPIYLTAGQPYYFEVNQLSGHTNQGHCSVAWSVNGGARTPLPGSAVSSFAPTATDNEDDRLLDSWESQFGLDPLDNGLVNRARQGEWGDFDNDGLCNRDEFIAGTNPANADTDSDNISDGEELRSYHTNPLVADAPTESIATAIDLSSFTSSTNAWSLVNGGLVPNSFRGSIKWNISLGESGIFLLHASTTLTGQLRAHEELDVVVKIDGRLLGRYTLVYGTDHRALLRAVTPHLAAGSHTVEIFIDNYVARRSLRIESVDLRKPGGVDTNADGIVDWIEELLNETDHITSHGAGSAISPACLEGSARFIEGVSVGSHAVLRGGDQNHWFHNLPLNADGSQTAYSVSYDSGQSENGSIRWLATNVLNGGEIIVRTGDSLRLTADDGTGAGAFSLNLAATTGGKAFFSGYLPTTLATATEIGGNYQLDDIISASGTMAGSAIGAAREVNGYHYARSGDTATFQLQFFDGTFTKVTKIALTEDENGVLRAYQVASYHKRGNFVGEDFETNSPIASSSGAGGYGVVGLIFDTSGTEQIEGQTEQPEVATFRYPGTVQITATRADGGASGQLTVHVRQANLPDDTSVVQNLNYDLTLNDIDTSRALDFSSGAGLSVQPPASINSSSYKIKLVPEWGGGYGLLARLWPSGPISDVGDIVAIGVSDALQNELQTANESPDFPNYNVLTTPLVVSHIPAGGYVKVTIFRAGVTFLDGSTVKIFSAEDLANGLVMLEFLTPKGMEGGYCHYLDIYGPDGKYLGRR